MGLRFRKSVKAGPLRINFSKSGVGYSIGSKGFRYTKKAGGGTRTTASIPGTGISYVQETGKKKRGTNVKQQRINAPKQDKTPQIESRTATATFHAVNISVEGLKKLARLNPEWKLSNAELLASCSPGQRIYQLLFENTPVQLVPATGDTIAVIVAGQTVGYVGDDMKAQISEIIKGGKINQVSCGIFGGQYRIINDDHTVSAHKASISIIVRVNHTVAQMVPGYQKPATSADPSAVTKTELLLGLLLGWAGGHKFYRKKFGMGILYLFTFGLFFIGWLGDAIQLCISHFGKKQNATLPKFQKVGSYILAAVLVFLMGSCGGNADRDSNAIPTDAPVSTGIVADAETEEPEEAAAAPTENEAPTEEPTDAPTDPPETDTPTEAPTEPEKTEPEGTTYILNTNTNKFHYPSCSDAKKIQDKNKSTFTGTRDEVIARGYEPCGNCHP